MPDEPHDNQEQPATETEEPESLLDVDDRAATPQAAEDSGSITDAGAETASPAPEAQASGGQPDVSVDETEPRAPATLEAAEQTDAGPADEPAEPVADTAPFGGAGDGQRCY